MADLSEFLLTRIAEDEATDPQWGFLLNVTLHATDCLEFGAVDRSDAKCDCDGPKRWLAECEVKRQVVLRCVEILAVNGWEEDDAYDLAWDNLCSLALPYAEHPDYCAEWRP